jgi:Ca-activated chloride channel family protein
MKNGFYFKPYEKPYQSPFDKLFDIFKELITHTSGDFDEAIDWLRELDMEYKLTTPDYTIEDFIEDLKKKGYIREEIKDGGGEGFGITAKTERAIRQNALDQIFGKIKKSASGNHKSKHSGEGDEHTGQLREYKFGDGLDKISLTESIKNAQINNGIEGGFNLTENDLVVEETQFKAQMSTVLMIDISHSMILYGEDRITPAKKVAMALAELITTRYPKDTLDILVFGNDAWTIPIRDLPYLKVGPYHTNTVAGLQLAMDILRRKRNTNKQIFMITDGKPSCIREKNGDYYKNSFGLDEYIVDKCYNQAAQARKLHIPITTFMIASDPYLQQFVQHFTQANQGKAFYTGLKGLGEMIFEDYENNRKKRIK